MNDVLGASRPSRRVLRGVVGSLSILAVLELAVRLGGDGAGAIPPPSAVMATAASLLVDPDFLVNLAWTLAAWALGLALATAIALPLGALLAASPRTELAATTAIDFVRPIPSVALIPLAILALGRGLDMRVALVAFAATWPILFNTITGLRSVDPVARDTARAFGLDRRAILRRVALPSAMPFIATGLRISAATALILAVSTELIAGGPPGLGTWMIGVTQPGVPRELLYAGIAIAGLLGLAINGVLVGTERRLVGWDVRVRSDRT